MRCWPGFATQFRVCETQVRERALDQKREMPDDAPVASLQCRVKHSWAVELGKLHARRERGTRRRGVLEAVDLENALCVAALK
eukprot:2552227-Rhodomonas_salina.4